jgi:hypothetical protein
LGDASTPSLHCSARPVTIDWALNQPTCLPPPQFRFLVNGPRRPSRGCRDGW